MTYYGSVDVCQRICTGMEQDLSSGLPIYDNMHE